MALTTFKFMVAGQHLGDYHDNFDTKTFFKWCCALALTYPAYLKQLQRRKDERKLPNPPPYDFWDFAESDQYPHGRPLVKFILSMDNAPYHHGVVVQLSQKSKEEIASILRDQGIDHILVSQPPHDDGRLRSDLRFEVPLKIPDTDTFAPWPRNDPTAAQVREGALRALISKCPDLVSPPWKEMFARLKASWGPLGGIDVIFSCPFISKQIPIELLWADGKNYVAHSRQHVDGVGSRSLAHVHDMLLNRWEGHAGANYSQSGKLLAS